MNDNLKEKIILGLGILYVIGFFTLMSFIG